MALLFQANNQATKRKRNNKNLTSTRFKQQPGCTPLAPTRNKIIYKTTCSEGPNSGLENLLKIVFAQKDLPTFQSGPASQK